MKNGNPLISEGSHNRRYNTGMKKQEKPECEHFVGASLYTDKPFCEICGERPSYEMNEKGEITGWKWKKKADKSELSTA